MRKSHSFIEWLFLFHFLDSAINFYKLKIFDMIIFYHNFIFMEKFDISNFFVSSKLYVTLVLIKSCTVDDQKCIPLKDINSFFYDVLYHFMLDHHFIRDNQFNLYITQKDFNEFICFLHPCVYIDN